MIFIVFRTRVNEGVPEEQIAPLLERMYEPTLFMPGFISYKDFMAPDGENVAIVEFSSLETLEAWRQHAEHKEAQRFGRGKLFAEHQVHMCTLIRSYGFPERVDGGSGGTLPSAPAPCAKLLCHKPTSEKHISSIGPW